MSIGRGKLEKKKLCKGGIKPTDQQQPRAEKEQPSKGKTNLNLKFHAAGSNC